MNNRMKIHNNYFIVNAVDDRIALAKSHENYLVITYIYLCRDKFTRMNHLHTYSGYTVTYIITKYTLTTII